MGAAHAIRNPWAGGTLKSGAFGLTFRMSRSTRSAIIARCLSEASLMPIYEYRCSSCGHQQDFLQKLSDPPMTDCPECKKSTFSKQVTAAGFQLKGTGWYATDFKNSGGSKPSTSDSKTSSSSDSGTSSDSGKSDAAPACGSGACSACS